MNRGIIKVGIDIGGTKILLIAEDDQIEHRYQCATGKDFTSAAAELIITKFIESLPQSPTSIGIAIPGLVAGSGRVIACDVLPQIVGWLPLVNSDLICPIRIINDTEAALIKTIDRSTQSSTVVVIMVGTGIGASFYVNGQILRGAKGWAGEFGSIPIRIEAGVMTLDRLASGAAILQRFGGNLDRLIRSVENQDVATLTVISDAGLALGLGIATIINIFNPDSIVLAGGTLNWTGYLDAALASAQQFSLPDLWAATQIHRSSHGSDLVALGAALAGSLA